MKNMNDICELIKFPKVSIVTVVYNAQDVLEKAILSVLNQAYDNIEYLIIDGKSTDSTVEIIKKYDNNIIWISEPDNGIFDAMNKGLKISTGDWMLFLGADDTLEPDGIQNLINHTNDADIVYGNTHLIFKNGQKRKQFSDPVECIKHKMIAAHQSFIVKKKVFDTIGNFNLEYKLSADYDFMIRAYLSNHTFKKINEFVANYNIYGQSSNIIQNTQELYNIHKKYKFKRVGLLFFLKRILKDYLIMIFKILFQDKTYLYVVNIKDRLSANKLNE